MILNDLSKEQLPVIIIYGTYHCKLRYITQMYLIPQSNL